MHNEQLEQLIDAALKDGTISKIEKKVLLNEAQSLGIDIHEFEEELQRRLLKQEKGNESNENTTPADKLNNVVYSDENPQERDDAQNEFISDKTVSEIHHDDGNLPKKEQYGGGQETSLSKQLVDALKVTISSKMQNYIDKAKEKANNVSHSGKNNARSASTNAAPNTQRANAFAKLINNGNLSSKKLNDILDDIVDGEYMTSADCEDMYDFRELKAQKKRVKEALVQFPTPSDKDDLLDFMLYLKPKIQHSEHSDAFLMKYNECVEKVEMLYPEDPDFEKIIGSEVKKNSWGKIRGNMKKTGMVMGGMGRGVGMVMAGIGRGLWILLKIAVIAIVIIVILAITGAL